MLIAIDPGDKQSAYVTIDEEYEKGKYTPIEFGKVDNEELLKYLKETFGEIPTAVEMIASYGMPVGKEVFETCVWIGRFAQVIEEQGGELDFVYRKDVKMALCGTTKAKDSNIRQALIDRFGGVGTKKKPGFFYGFKSDIWSAFAVGATYLDNKKFNERLANTKIY